MKIYIGHDGREQRSFDVAARSARKYGAEVVPLYEQRLRMSGMLTRPLDRRGGMWDLNSNAPCSTDFAISRFFVPLLAHTGWCLFVDSDVVFLDNPEILFTSIDDSKAVHVVKHGPITSPATKMDGQIQTSYPRKLWSSVILWNVDHPGNRRLNLQALNQWPGRDLHAFAWLSDDEIGSLPATANWLVGLQPKPARPIVAHYTLGTPAMAGYENCEHADLWHAEAYR